jgi:hypothetical protein
MTKSYPRDRHYFYTIYDTRKINRLREIYTVLDRSRVRTELI